MLASQIYKDQNTSTLIRNYERALKALDLLVEKKEDLYEPNGYYWSKRTVSVEQMREVINHIEEIIQ